MFRNGFMSTDEVRDLEDLPPVEGGDQRYISRDLWPADRYDEFIKSQTNSTEK